MEYEKIIEPRVNDTPFSLYGAQMLDFSVGGVGVKNGYLFTPSAFFPVVVLGEITLRRVKITLDFSGLGWQETERAISDLTAVFLAGCDLLLPDGFYYRCAFDQNSAPKRPAPWISTATFEFDGVRHGRLEQRTLTASGSFVVEGNRPAPARLTVSGISGTVTVAGITITGLTGTVVIDGLSRKVTQNGSNVFGNTDLTTFPKLTPGRAEIVFTAGLTVKVEYYPLYM